MLGRGLITSYQLRQPDQAQLLSSVSDNSMPIGRLASFLAETLDQLELSAVHVCYAKGMLRN
jgi:hypothetical protein